MIEYKILEESLLVLHMKHFDLVKDNSLMCLLCFISYHLIFTHMF